MADRLVPIDEILSQVYDALTKQHSAVNDMGSANVVRWAQDIIYCSYMNDDVYDEILIVAKDTIDE